jgi:membrane-associated phospholipid phosphatase
MRRYLLVALWPAGMITIAAAAAVAIRRAPVAPPQPSAGESAAGTAGFGAPVTAAAQNGTPPRPSRFTDPDPDLAEWREGVLKLAAISLAGGVLAYRVMELAGLPVVKYGHKIDVPAERWAASNQVPAWTTVVTRLNNVGSSWTSWAAAGTAAACLSATWSRQKWLPPSVLASAVLVDKCTTLALRRAIGRVGPPSSPNGTYPAGGPDRAVLFTALIANMLWREFSGSGRGKALALGTIGGFAFNISYCRHYLGRHWLTDIVSGLVYGAVLYVPFAAAIRLIAGPPVAAVAGPPMLAIPVQRDGRQDAGTLGTGRFELPQIPRPSGS